MQQLLQRPCAVWRRYKSIFSEKSLKLLRKINPPHLICLLAPCPPDGIKVQLLPMEMEVQLLHFSWTHVTCGSIEYLLTLTGTLQGQSNLFEVSSYWTSTDFFEIPLPCSSSYTAMLQSKNAAGTSGKSAPLNGTTGRLYSYEGQDFSDTVFLTN